MSSGESNFSQPIIPASALTPGSLQLSYCGPEQLVVMIALPFLLPKLLGGGPLFNLPLGKISVCRITSLQKLIGFGNGIFQHVGKGWHLPLFALVSGSGNFSGRTLTISFSN